MQSAPAVPLMSQDPDAPAEPPDDRRSNERGQLHGAENALYSTLRFIARHVRGFWAGIATFLTLAFAAGAAATAIFAAFAGAVDTGITQQADERVVEWFARHRTPLLDAIMLEVTSLGNGVVLIMIVGIVSIFMWLTHHRWSVYLLLVGVIGGQLMNHLLKSAFDRPRPVVVDWVDSVSTTSFPSGHAMSAIIAYGSVAYLVARLEPTVTLRRVTWAIATVIILGIGISRMYLGVHYPSDVVAGFLAGLAWVMFVASSMAAVRFFSPRRPETHAEEHGLDEDPADDEHAPAR